MKKYSLLLGLILVASVSFGQGSCKKHVISCWSFLRDSFIEDAKTSIDKAMDCADTKDWYKTWWYKGQTYHALGVSEKPKHKALCNGTCLDEAFEAYLKAMVLNFTDPELKKIDLNTEEGLIKFYGALNKSDVKFEDDEALIDIIQNRLPGLANAFINKGVDAFQNSTDYKKSLEYFEKAILASTLSMQVDTQVIYFASLAAKKANEFDKAIQYNEALIQMKFGANDDERANIYLSQAQCYAAKGDTAKMITTLQKGIEKYPANSFNLIIETFNYYVSTGQNQKAYEYISMAIDKNPKDPQFFVIRGTLLEQMNRRVDASKEYEKALELDPNNADAIYSMGAFYYNQAADTIAWANDNIPPTDFAAYDAVKAAADELFKKAVPFLEKSHALNPKDINVLNTLKTIYYRLGDIPKHDAIKAELDALTQ
ncbi:MAG TPA: tetratricopeptide repeat protein [Bacteroidales bacterium]|nr:tetratricopeptide repeat protein [Bacteroidales bacterium]